MKLTEIQCRIETELKEEFRRLCEDGYNSGVLGSKSMSPRIIQLIRRDIKENKEG